MSFRVLVMPEDPTNNGYILKPLVEKILSAAGKRSATVTVATNPKAEGYSDAKRILKEDIIPTYSFMSLILFLPDSDGKDRSGEFEALYRIAEKQGANLICCAAVTEVEAWLLAGHINLLQDSWLTVRNDPKLKETYFDPFLAKYGNPKSADKGRSALMLTTLRNYRGLKSRCPEIQELEDRIRDFLKKNP
ncbi:MAG: hypothetical protein IT350_03075 [Deltaproteobacteria bacterium]|nr:hypothetical protein [Deltaproteobacteria bacterium]